MKRTMKQQIRYYAPPGRRALLSAGAAALLAALLLSAGGCTTNAEYIKSDGPILRLADLVYQGDSGELTRLSNTPFLLDSEILLRRSHVRTLWENLAQAGLRLPETEILLADTVNAGTWRAFGTAGPGEKAGLETRSFFMNYVSDQAALIRLRTAQGTFLLLLDGRENRYPRISGIRGPLDE